MFHRQETGAPTANEWLNNTSEPGQANTNPWLNMAEDLNKAADEFTPTPETVNDSAELDADANTETEGTESDASETISEVATNEPVAETSETESDTAETTDLAAVANLAEQQEAEVAAGVAIEETLADLAEQEETTVEQDSGTTNQTTKTAPSQPESSQEETTQTETDVAETPDDESAAEASESKESIKNKEVLASSIGSLSKIIIISEAEQAERQNPESAENINRLREQKHTLGVLQEAYGRLESDDQTQPDLPLEGIFAQVATHYLSLGKLNLEMSEDPKNQNLVSEESEHGETLSEVYYQQAEACYWRAAVASDFAGGKFESFLTNLNKQAAEVTPETSENETSESAPIAANTNVEPLAAPETLSA